MKPLADIAGQTFGELRVLRRASGTCKGHARWACLCSCGREFTALGTNIRRGRTQSCGHGQTKHGRADHPDYNIWIQMHRRCSNPKAKSYPHYGARGIKVCERWNDIELFLADMGPRPEPRMEIERIDNNGDYEPGNCRWATRLEQMQNTRQVSRFEHDGENLTLTEWSQKTGIRRSVLNRRLREGWDLKRALTQPARAEA